MVCYWLKIDTVHCSEIFFFLVNFTLCCCCLVAKSCPTLFATPLTVARQALLSMGFSRQEYWSGLLFPSPGDLPDLRDQTQGLNPRLLQWQSDSSLSHQGSPLFCVCVYLEEEMVTHSSILAWKIPWTEEPGRLQSTGLQRVRHECSLRQHIY